ncbi:MAG TPA: NADP-dependent phosphogluconate dehydrogenase [Chloroflexota bacterium]|nr:NADP-dependent phosphogluconate dehydrogenase [Chloroflexota bacterium]
MKVQPSDIGLIGLAVMGENLALNMANHGFKVSVYNRTAERTRTLANGRAKGTTIQPTYDLKEFVASLAKPRRIFLMVQAGAPVDSVLAQLRPLLEAGDIVMDGGNSYYKDTERRTKEMEAAGFHYFGVGVSGGEAGALEGPCIMPGGSRAAYPLIEPILTAIAAKVSDGACVAYMGPGGAGHYVKMVHNGCEYAIMQLIAETYDVLRTAYGLGAVALADVFRRWNDGKLNSYLIEITAKVLAFVDPETKQPLVDLILDRAGQKGTGKWTSQDALDLGVTIPNIDAALWGRNISALKDERVHASTVLTGPRLPALPSDQAVLDTIEDALYTGIIISYAQAMAMLRAASHEYSYDLNLSEIARIWKGGCIIRSKLLDPIQAAFKRDPDLANLLVDSEFSGNLNQLQASVRSVVRQGIERGIPLPAFGASLAYFDSYRRAQLPVNLIQAQRDFFGAHTYQRIDRPGTFHTDWE